MNRGALVAAVARRTGYNPIAVDRILTGILEEVERGMVEDRVTIAHFGSFSLRRLQGGNRINPTNQKMMVTPSRWYPHFQPAKRLRERVAGLKRS